MRHGVRVKKRRRSKTKYWKVETLRSNERKNKDNEELQNPNPKRSKRTEARSVPLGKLELEAATQKVQQKLLEL